MGKNWGTRAFARTQGLFLSLVVVHFSGASAFASTHLFLVGGGNLPNEATARFETYAGGAKGNVLVINWATTLPVDSYQWFAACLREGTPGNVPTAVSAMSAAQVQGSKADFYKQLNAATGVFFNGGDQTRIMALLTDPNYSDIADAMRAKYESGVPFGGTSAGMAIMSKDMFNGNEDPTLVNPNQPNFFQPGLGLLAGVIVDAHFLVRQRENRFLSYLLGHQDTLGVGIDEDGVVEVTNGEFARVIGNKQVMMADMLEHPKDGLLKILEPGDTYDLFRRQKLSSGVPKVAPLCSATHGFSEATGL